MAASGFAKHAESTNQVAWSPVAPYTLGTTSVDQGVLLWDHRDGGTSPAATLGAKRSGGELNWFDFAADGRLVAVVHSASRFSSQLTIYDVRGTQKILSSTSLPYQSTCLNWIRDTDCIAVGTSQGKLWIAHAPSLISKEINNNGDNENNNQANQYNQQDQLHNQINDHSTTIAVHNAQILSIHSRHQYLVSGGSDSMIQVFDTSTLASLCAFSHSDTSARAVTISPDALLIASAHELEIAFNTLHAKPVGTLPSSVWALAWHPSRSILAMAGQTSRASKYVGHVGIANFEEAKS